MQAVIISFDSLAANSLGCYGNDWIETPHWDRLAATGVVFDRHFADTTGPLAGMAWATGQHASLPSQSSKFRSLGERLKSAGVTTRLVTAFDDHAWQQAAEFEQTIRVTGHDGFDAQPGEVSFAEVVKAGLSLWTQPEFQQTPRLLWLHSCGPSLPPRGFDSLYFEDFAERGEQIEELSDDERAQHPAVYAGAVSLFDHWLGELLATIETSAEPTLIVVMAAKGYVWQRIKRSKLNEPSPRRELMCDQSVRAPLSLRVSGDDRFHEFVCIRSDRLVQTCDLVPTLIDWFGVKASVDQPLAGQSWLKELTEEAPTRESLLIGNNEHIDAVRTADWLCIRDQTVQPQADSATLIQPSLVSLFSKPQDIWDVDDIASQHPDVVSDLWNRQQVTPQPKIVNSSPIP